jgi:hypothetical protein
MKRLVRTALRAAFLGGVASTAPFAAVPDVSQQAPIELPAYTVTDSRELPPPEHWSYGRIEGFEILSNASDRATRDLVNYFQRFAQALDVVWPEAHRTTEVPVALVICGRGGKFDEFLPPAEGVQFDRGKISLSLRGPQQSAIVVDYEARELDIDPPGEIGSSPPMEVDAHDQLAREYVRFRFGGAEPPLPPWFIEGIAQIFMAMEVSKTIITVGRVEDPNLVPIGPPEAPREWDRGFNGALKNRALMPMDELLRAPADSETVRNPIGSTWAKQSAAFVHWGLYGNNGRDQKAFVRFVLRATREPVTEELFKDCFKLSYKQMLDELRSYVSFTVYKMKEFRAKKGEKLPDLPPFALREATQAEVGRIKGETLQLAGHPAAARNTILAAYIRGERDPQLLATLGLQERAAGEAAHARKFLEAAVQGKVARPRAYLELARMRVEEIEQVAAGKTWTAAQMDHVTSPLLTARGQSPSLPEIYELLAATWLRSSSKPEIAQLKIADEGVRRYPRDLNLIYDTAVLMQRAGRPADAAMLVQHGLSVARSDEARTTFRELQATLPPIPVTPVSRPIPSPKK